MIKERTADQEVQRRIASAARGLNRRSFLHRAAGVTATAVASVVLGPLGGKEQVLAHSGYPCYFPCGAPCGGCAAGSGCPSGYQNCYKGDHFDPNENCCIYGDSWWYSGGGVGNRHKCRDCRIIYCPCCCTSSCCSGFCGCRSTTHY